jgi:hypothetical protein
MSDWPKVEVETLHRTFEIGTGQTFVLRTYSDPHDEKVCPD